MLVCEKNPTLCDIVSTLHQEYLLVDTSRQQLEVLFNYSYDEDCPWKHVKCNLLPPACLPETLTPIVGSAYEVVSANEWILRAAVEAGVDIPNERLKTVCTSLKVMLPGPKQGSGKGGNRKRVDYVRSLVQHL